MILIMMSCSSNMSNNTLDAGIVVMLLCISYGWLSGVFGTILHNCGVSEEIRLRDDEEKSTSIVFFHDDDSNSYPKISSGDVGKATDTRIESTTLLSIVVEVYNFRRMENAMSMRYIVSLLLRLYTNINNNRVQQHGL